VVEVKVLVFPPKILSPLMFDSVGKRLLMTSKDQEHFGKEMTGME
jgi:hypothetical protein